MKIVYPSLVQGAFSYLRTVGNKVSQQEVFLNLYEKGLINECGEPTEEAIAKGFVQEFTETEEMSFEEFLTVYPLFKVFSTEEFKMIEGFWEIKRSLQETLLADMAAEAFSYEELIQLSAYFEDR